MKSIVIIAGLLAVAYAHELRIHNNCHFTIWPGFLNNPGKPLPANGGFKLDAHKVHSIQVPKGWAGRVWGRTHCNAHGHCETGDCGEYGD